MGTIIIKPERDRDFYVGWSTITESPHWWGSRAEVTEYLSETANPSLPDTQPDRRLARTDRYGTSDMTIREGARSDGRLIYEQRGVLPRERLIEMCRLLEAGDEAAVWDLLEPLEGRAEVRRG